MRHMRGASRGGSVRDVLGDVHRQARFVRLNLVAGSSGLTVCLNPGAAAAMNRGSERGRAGVDQVWHQRGRW